MSGDIPQDTFEGRNVEHEGEALKRTRSRRIIRKPLKYKDFIG